MNIYEGRVFILGAGFSAGAGVPLTQYLLPLAAKLFNAEAPGLFERISNYASNVDVDLTGSPDAEDFARFCTYLDFIELREHGGGERWSEEGSRERVALKFYLAKAIADHTPEPADLPSYYVDFASALTPNDIVVSFNWDLLLENALDLAGKKYCYNFEPEKIHILKFHGSINWIQGAPWSMGRGRPSFGYVPLGFEEGMVGTEVYCSEQLKTKYAWQTARGLVDEVKLLLVLPGYGNAVDVRLLAGLWYRPEFLNIRNGGVSIIGLSVADDDYLVESLFRYLFRATFDRDKQVRVLNPAKDVPQKSSKLANDEVKISAKTEKFESNTLDYALHR